MPAKNINLLERAEFDKTPLGKFLRWSLTYGRYIIICTEIIVLLAFIYRFSLDRKFTDLSEEIEQKSAIIEANQGFEQQFRNLQNRTELLGKLFVNQDKPVRLLSHLEEITPQGITYEKLTYSEDQISISAVSTTNSSFSVFVNNLKASPFLSQINIASLTKKSEGTGEIKFSVEAIINPAVTTADKKI